MHINRRLALLTAGPALLANALQARATSPAGRDQVEAIALAKKNANIARRQVEVHNSGDVVAASTFFAEDTRNHGAPVGRQGVLRVLTDIQTTFPDWRMEIEDLAAIGEDVIIRGTVTGTHRGVGRIAVNGGLLIGVPPTGRTFKVQHIHWFTFKDGLIVEHRANRDDVGMMQQLGLLPAAKTL